jgi:hypothetical protein
MRVSEKQLLLLVQVLRDSLPIVDGMPFVLSQVSRKELLENILNQQDIELIDVSEKEGA